MIDGIYDYLKKFEQSEQGDEKGLTAVCRRYIFASAEENCCISFATDPRFADLNKFKEEKRLRERCGQMVQTLNATAAACVKNGRPENAAAAYRVATRLMEELQLSDSPLYRGVREKLEALA